MQKKTKKGYLGRESLVEKLVIPVEDVKAQSRRGCGSGEEGRHPHPEHVPHPCGGTLCSDSARKKAILSNLNKWASAHGEREALTVGL